MDHFPGLDRDLVDLARETDRQFNILSRRDKRLDDATVAEGKILGETSLMKGNNVAFELLKMVLSFNFL